MQGEKACRMSFAFHNRGTIIPPSPKVEASLGENKVRSPSWLNKNERPQEAKKMKTRRQLAASPGDQRPAAAKQEPAVTALADARATRRRSSGWDPYEVWRTRVKGDEQTPADDAEATPAA